MRYARNLSKDMMLRIFLNVMLKVRVNIKNYFDVEGNPVFNEALRCRIEKLALDVK